MQVDKTWQKLPESLPNLFCLILFIYKSYLITKLTFQESTIQMNTTSVHRIVPGKAGYLVYSMIVPWQQARLKEIVAWCTKNAGY